MTIFEIIIQYFFDKSKKLSTRLILGLSFLIFLYCINDLIGFTYYYQKNVQLEQLKSISSLLKDSQISNETKKSLIELENEVFKRKSNIELMIFYFKKKFETNTKTIQTKIKPNTKLVPSNKNNNQEKNEIYYILSISGIFLLGTILSIIILIFQKNIPLFNLLFVVLILFILLIAVIQFNSWLFELIIPNKVFGNWIWNYVLNLILQILFILFLNFLFKRKKT